MPRSRTTRHKTSRRFGLDVYGTGGTALQRRLGTRPGGRVGTRRRRTSDYGQQLVEKQKLKAIYGIRERQFRRYVEGAARLPGPHGANLLVLLERRLDNVVYRLAFARSRPMARQLVNHGHVRIDGARVSIPSYLVGPGEEVALTDDAAALPVVQQELAAGRPVPSWLERAGGSAGRIVRAPERDEIDVPIDERLVVGFYSR